MILVTLSLGLGVAKTVQQAEIAKNFTYIVTARKVEPIRV